MCVYYISLLITDRIQVAESWSRVAVPYCQMSTAAHSVRKRAYVMQKRSYREVANGKKRHNPQIVKSGQERRRVKKKG